MPKENQLQNTKVALFRGRRIRKIIHNKGWWFSVVDVVVALTDSVNARDYWYKMKVRVKDEEGSELSTFCLQLKLESADGKQYDALSTKYHLYIVKQMAIMVTEGGNHAANICQKVI